MAMSLQNSTEGSDTPGSVARQSEGIAELYGWANWRKQKAYRAVDRHTGDRLRRWLCRKHKVQGAGTTRYPDRYLYQKLNLVQLEVRRRNVTWANA